MKQGQAVDYPELPVLQLQRAPDGTEGSVVPSQSEDFQSEDSQSEDGKDDTGPGDGKTFRSDQDQDGRSTVGHYNGVNSIPVTSPPSGLGSQATTSAAPNGTTDEPPLFRAYQQYCDGVRQTGYPQPSYELWKSQLEAYQDEDPSALFSDPESYSTDSDDDPNSFGSA
jgi:hypothetical protein